MAGHNKWSKIKRKKGAKDVARSSAFSRASRAIEAASRACSGDMDDLHLQSTIAHAKSIQLPKERVADAIDRGANPRGGSGVDLARMRYDAMVPTNAGGTVACIVTALTDNRNRTAGNVRAAVTKAGGELLSTGANDWMFEHVGVALVPKIPAAELSDNDVAGNLQNEEWEEELLECSLEGGAIDVDFGEGDDFHALVKCDVADLYGLVTVLREAGHPPDEFESRYMLKDERTTVKLEGDSADKLETFLGKMDNDLDVTNVFHNAS